MSSFLRRIEKRIAKAAGQTRGDDGNVYDAQGEYVGPSWRRLNWPIIIPRAQRKRRGKPKAGATRADGFRRAMS